MRFDLLASALAFTSVLVSGCTGYDQWAENTNKKMNTGWTELINGKQTVDKSALPPGVTVNLTYGKGEGVGIPGRAASKFYDKLLGDVTYNRSCPRLLSISVAMMNDQGALVRNEDVLVAPYQANVKALISKDVMTDPMMSKSSQVSRLVLSNLRCI